MLTITNLCKTYSNGVRALHNVNLTIGKGMFGLLGPNGAGKSTLMRTIATLQAPDGGAITFEGIDILTKPVLLRNVLGYLPQEFGVYPGISAYQLLDHLAVLKGLVDKQERKEQVEALLHLTNLYGERKKVVKTFSGGMKQRFGIAQALLGDPKLIIVDEPTAGLDPEERNRFYNLLSEIGQQVVVILSTHIVEDVRRLCPEMAIMANGQVIVQGSPQHLIAELENRIWCKQVPRAQLDTCRAKHETISTQMVSGQTYISVLANQRPDPLFQSISPGLEEVYFVALSAHKSNSAVD